METTRIDRWISSVRLYKQRPLATDACRRGQVKINGSVAKPSTPVKIGDVVEAKIGDRQRILEVVKVIEKRVGAPVAAECYIDHSPPPVPREKAPPPPPRREPGAGRPTKRERRRIDKFRGR